MSQPNQRWYVLGREGGRYVILGWSRTVEHAEARVAKLTRQGKYGNALAATGRPMARRRAKQIFGITVSYLKRDKDTKRWEWTTDE